VALAALAPATPPAAVFPWRLVAALPLQLAPAAPLIAFDRVP
jgi:hypothetical protein